MGSPTQSRHTIKGPKGDPGADGAGITAVVDNGDGTATVTFDNGKTAILELVPGPVGPKGDTGAQGPK